MPARKHRCGAHVYGPVPSRRLGRSLGVDLVPFKTCSYDCVYCQLGRTTHKTIERKNYVEIEEVLIELEQRLDGEDAPRYISLAGSGEPTLHRGIGTLIQTIKYMTDIPVAVLTNGSLLWMEEVQRGILEADLVIPSLDAGDERLFRRVNRPHPGISFDRMVDGIAAFTKRFQGSVWLEVFLLAGVTGISSEVAKIAALAAHIAPARVQLNTVSRPPSEDYACAVPEPQLRAFAESFGIPTDVIGEYGGGDAAAETADTAAEEIMALVSRRPCSAEDIAAGLRMHITEVTKILPGLLSAGKIETIEQDRERFYIARGKTP